MAQRLHTLIADQFACSMKALQVVEAVGDRGGRRDDLVRVRVRFGLGLGSGVRVRGQVRVRVRGNVRVRGRVRVRVRVRVRGRRGDHDGCDGQAGLGGQAELEEREAAERELAVLGGEGGEHGEQHELCRAGDDRRAAVSRGGGRGLGLCGGRGLAVVSLAEELARVELADGPTVGEREPERRDGHGRVTERCETRLQGDEEGEVGVVVEEVVGARRHARGV